MPDERTTSTQARDQFRAFRKAVADAVGELRSNQVRSTYAALSLEELMDQHIDRLTNDTDPIRISPRQRVERVHKNITDNIMAMKATDPASFGVRDSATDANTNPDGSDADPVSTGAASTTTGAPTAPAGGTP